MEQHGEERPQATEALARFLDDGHLRLRAVAVGAVASQFMPPRPGDLFTDLGDHRLMQACLETWELACDVTRLQEYLRSGAVDTSKRYMTARAYLPAYGGMCQTMGYQVWNIVDDPSHPLGPDTVTFAVREGDATPGRDGR